MKSSLILDNIFVLIYDMSLKFDDLHKNWGDLRGCIAKKTPAE